MSISKQITEAPAISYEARKAISRELALNLFYAWVARDLQDISRRCASEGYEAYHERRLALGLSEDQATAGFQEWKRRRDEQWAFDARMFRHLGEPKRSCGDMSCNYCGTWADHVRGEMDEPPVNAPVVVAMTDAF